MGTTRRLGGQSSGIVTERIMGVALGRSCCMKREEKIAEAFLKGYFQEDPIYEPLRKSAPPDFCIGRTAFEVRRLNQNYVYKDGTPEGLEQVSHSLNRAVSIGNLVRSHSRHGGSFFWGLELMKGRYARASRKQLRK